MNDMACSYVLFCHGRGWATRTDRLGVHLVSARVFRNCRLEHTLTWLAGAQTPLYPSFAFDSKMGRFISACSPSLVNYIGMPVFLILVAMCSVALNWRCARHVRSIRVLPHYKSGPSH